jgi:hypothetical protein
MKSTYTAFYIINNIICTQTINLVFLDEYDKSNKFINTFCQYIIDVLNEPNEYGL